MEFYQIFLGTVLPSNLSKDGAVYGIMKKINVLLLNFDIENTIQPLVDRGKLYVIHTGEKVEDVKRLYRNYRFNLILIKISEGLVEGFRALDYFRNVSPRAKIIVVSENPTFQDAFQYTKYGVYNFRGPFTGLFELVNTLRFSSQQGIFGNLLDNIKVRLTNLLGKSTLLSLSTVITDTALACLAKTRGEFETVEHLNGVSQYARLIAEKLCRTKERDKIFSQNYIQYIYLGSKLHDIGKIDIPQKIATKPGFLTKQELEIVKTHTHYGYEMLSAIEQSAERDLQDFFKIAKEIVLYHHEHYDGTGYPYGLKGKDIPLSARICALADSYAALASDRPYRKAFSHEKVQNIILYEESGKYDSEILEIFKRYNKEFKEISNVFRKNIEIYPDKKTKKQCAWCKSLFLFNKWLAYNEILYATHIICPKCQKKLQKTLM